MDVVLESKVNSSYEAGRSTAIGFARRAIGANRHLDAVRICNHLLRQDPRDAEVAMLRFDLHVSAGEYEEAYELIGPFVQPRAATDILLRAAFAAAYTGRSRSEMKEFCEGTLPFFPSLRFSPFFASRSLKAFRLSASLAVGTDACMSSQPSIAEMYLGLALQEDPSEPNAALLLERIYSDRHDFASALDALLKGRGRMLGTDARDADIRIRHLQRVVSAGSFAVVSTAVRSQFRVA
jgi:tetratricopeptide (TPR) repeat protein